ncbi:MAG TPA: glycosyltransferase [Opitutaceae bacterium]|nr:glycosyltransferase [Opitutaceae bacterium]
MNPPVLVISNIDWAFVWQRHQTVASLFAREHNVIFCEIPGLRRVTWRDAGRVLGRFRRVAGRNGGTEPVPDRITILRPFVLPATNAVFCALNRWLIARFVRRTPALQSVGTVVAYSPTCTTRQLLECVRHGPVVYDCTDDWGSVAGIPARLPADERWLLATADLTLVPSRRLEELKRPDARRLVRLPHGAFVERFLVEARPVADPGRLTVLYYGHLHSQHLDFAAIAALARARPGWRVILVGPVKTPFAFPGNVELPGQQPHERLREWIASADALLLPYALNPYTEAVMPAKTYECLATGRPIIATPLPELVAGFSGHMTFAAPGEDWAAAVERAVRTDAPDARSARIALAKDNSWAERFARLCELLAG